MTTATPGHSAGERAGVQSLARLVLVAFLLTFVTARVMVYLIMSRRAPDLYLHVGGTHVHHLNYGIFLLAAVAVETRCLLICCADCCNPHKSSPMRPSDWTATTRKRWFLRCWPTKRGTTAPATLRR